MSENILDTLNQTFVLATQFLKNYGIQIKPVKVILKPKEDPDAIYFVWALYSNSKAMIERIREQYKENEQQQ